MKWTKEPPQVKGYYWNRWSVASNIASIVYVSNKNKEGKQKLMLVGSSFYHVLDLSECDMEWAGPIPEPTEE